MDQKEEEMGPGMPYVLAFFGLALVFVIVTLIRDEQEKKKPSYWQSNIDFLRKAIARNEDQLQRIKSEAALEAEIQRLLEERRK